MTAKWVKGLLTEFGGRRFSGMWFLETPSGRWFATVERGGRIKRWEALTQRGEMEYGFASTVRAAKIAARKAAGV